MRYSLSRNILTYSAALCVFLGASTGAPIACAEELSAAVLSALKQHPSVDAAKASLNAAKEQRREQVSAFFPEFSVTGQAGRQFANNSTTRGLVTTRGEAYSDLGEGTLTLRQTIFDGMGMFKRLDAAAARQDSAFNTLFDIRESLALRAAQSYVNVARARIGADMIRKHRAKVSDYLERIQNMVKEGAASDAEYHQALDIQVILDGILADFEGQVMAAESQYAEAVGHMPDAELQKPDPPLDKIADDVKGAVQDALENHPSVIAAKHESRATSHDIGAETAALYPELNGELSYLKANKRDEIGGESEDARAVLRMNWNFSTGGAQFARIRRSKYTHKETLARLQEAKRQIERDVRLAFSEYQTAGRQLELLGKRRELNEKLFKTYTAQFEGARVNLLQLMQSDNQLFNTKLEGMNGLYRLISAQYAVLASTGRLQDSLGFRAVALHPEWKQAYNLAANEKESPVQNSPQRIAAEIPKAVPKPPPVELENLPPKKPPAESVKKAETKVKEGAQQQQQARLTPPSPYSLNKTEPAAGTSTVQKKKMQRLLTGLIPKIKSKEQPEKNPAPIVKSKAPQSRPQFRVLSASHILDKKPGEDSRKRDSQDGYKAVKLHNYD